jgi:hypothetical protein
LIATNMDHQVIHVWDLRKIWWRLAPLGLDWKGPGYPPEPPPPQFIAIPPLAVQIIGSVKAR